MPLMDFSDNIRHNKWNFPTCCDKVNTCDGLFRFFNIYQNCITFDDIFLKSLVMPLIQALESLHYLKNVFWFSITSNTLRRKGGDKLFAIFNLN